MSVTKIRVFLKFTSHTDVRKYFKALLAR